MTKDSTDVGQERAMPEPAPHRVVFTDTANGRAAYTTVKVADRDEACAAATTVLADGMGLDRAAFRARFRLTAIERTKR